MKKLLCCCVVLLGLIAPAQADKVRRPDGPTRDSSGSMDIKWAQHGHAGRKLAHVISTYDAWQNAELGGNGKFQINIAPGEAGVTRIILIYLDDSGKLVSKMYNVYDGSEVVGRPEVSRPTSRALKVTFPKRWLKRALEAYRYDVLYAEQQTEDTVPNDKGTILHRM